MNGYVFFVVPLITAYLLLGLLLCRAVFKPAHRSTWLDRQHEVMDVLIWFTWPAALLLVLWQTRRLP